MSLRASPNYVTPKNETFFQELPAKLILIGESLDFVSSVGKTSNNVTKFRHRNHTALHARKYGLKKQCGIHRFPDVLGRIFSFC
jgi:hypothetical protein